MNRRQSVLAYERIVYVRNYVGTGWAGPSVGSYECGEASDKRAYQPEEALSQALVHTINLTGQGCLGALSIKGLSMQSPFPFLQHIQPFR